MQIWYKDLPNFLGSQELVASFIPMPNTSLSDKLNAIFRFSIYYGVVVFALQSNWKALLIPVVTGCLTYAIFEYDEKDLRHEKEAMAEIGIERDQQTNKVCSVPTSNNPFMNVLPTQYSSTPKRPGACDISRPSVKDRVDKLFASTTSPAEATDIYGRNTGVRQFYATPSTTIPNDQASFAKWLYRDSSITSSSMGKNTRQMQW